MMHECICDRLAKGSTSIISTEEGTERTSDWQEVSPQNRGNDREEKTLNQTALQAHFIPESEPITNTGSMGP
jgi:hypothetical protein